MTGSRATEENRDRDTGNEKRAIQMRAKIERRGRRVKGTKQEQDRKKGTSEQRTNERERKEARKKTGKVDSEKPRRKQDETRDKRSTERTKTQKAEQRPGVDTTQRERERVYSRRHHGVIQALASMLLGPRSSVLGVGRVGRRPRCPGVSGRETCGERYSSNKQKRWRCRNRTGVGHWRRQRVQ